MKLKTSRYKMDLIDLHSICEANYARLMRLFPDYEQSNERRIEAGAARLCLTVRERCRYTTMLALRHTTPLTGKLGVVELELRLYHDARMAEVVGFQAHTRVKGRYQYPNQYMYARDEKRQQNSYIADLLAFCLAEGREPQVPLLAQQRVNNEVPT